MKKFIKLAAIGGAFLCVVAGVSYARVHSYAADAMKNRELDILAYYRYGVVPDSIVLDIRSVGLENSAAGTIGGLIKFAEEMSDREFRQVVLAWRGEARFVLSGRDFLQMGKEAGYQNPVYTIRTLPEKLMRPDGTEAFPTWQGGMLGVLGEQMDDVNKFAREWYLDDAIRRMRM